MCGPGGACPAGYTCVDQTCRAMPASDDASDPDDNIVADVPDGANVTPTCVGSGGWELCSATAPTSAVVLNTAINTDTSSSCATGVTWTSASQPDACVVAGTAISVDALVRVTGTRPLVLL